MSTNPKLDPQLAERLAKIQNVAGHSFPTPPTPEQIAADNLMDLPYGDYAIPDVTVISKEIAGPNGPIPVRIYLPSPEGQIDFGLVWCHGGAFMFGSLDMPEADLRSRDLCLRGGIAVISVDYRLANQTIKFPVPLQDVLAVWDWAVTQSDIIERSDNWFISGASAGGSLAAAATLELVRNGGPVPAGLLAIYPVVHAEVPRSVELDELMAPLPERIRFRPEMMQFINDTYLGQHSGKSPAAFVGDDEPLDGFPRTLVVVNEFDDLRDSGLEFAKELQLANCEVTQKLVPGFIHGHMNAIGHPLTAQTVQDMIDFIRS